MLLEIQNVSKIYKGKVQANDDISLSVAEGEVFGLLGPNGAAKTNLFNQIIGLTVPTSGTISISGVNVVANPGYARESCSFQAQVQAPISGLTALQAIELVGRIRGGKKADARKRAMELIEKLEIGEWKKMMGITISGGVRRLVAFCMAAVVPGKIVILDEPTNDIDPLRRRELWREVHALAKQGSAVLLVTHNVLEAERVVDRLAIIDKGRVIGMGTPADLKESEGEAMRLELTMEPGAARPETAPAGAYASNPHELGRLLECNALISVGELVIKASLERKASNSIPDFQRLDYPQMDPPEWNKLLPIRQENDKVKVRELPLDFHLKAPYDSSYEENYKKHALK